MVRWGRSCGVGGRRTVGVGRGVAAGARGLLGRARVGRGMCGRYSLFTPPRDLAERFDLDGVPDLEPRYNCAPGQALPVIRSDAPASLTATEWGLVPGWADDDFDGIVNARAETVDEKPSFREAYASRRCLVPADGFYEWTDADDGSRRPYRVAFGDDRSFAMAGIWERREVVDEQTGLDAFAEGGEAGPETRTVETFTILTTEPNDVVAELHDRMAVVLHPEHEREWLAGDVGVETVAEPYPSDELRAYPVSTRVNSPANDAPDLVEPVEG